MSRSTNLPTHLTIDALLEAYVTRSLSPVDVIGASFDRIEAEGRTPVWISVADREAALEQARQAERAYAELGAKALKLQPLLGVPYAVKDNIDAVGLPTTAACAAFSHLPEVSAVVVNRLDRAGAVLIGKTNLDQFATGLVGTRSPYGAVQNPFNPAYVSGGSSSGSAVAVSRGLVSFALGTDTAGSGRVPAGFCNLVGIKPTPGLVSTRGVLPACRTLDCVSVFALTVGDGWRVMRELAGFDEADGYSRRITSLPPLTRRVRIGVPDALEFFRDVQAQAAFTTAVELFASLPQVSLSTIGFAPLAGAAQLLYDGPWVAERRHALGRFFDDAGEQIDPVVRAVIGKADAYSAVDGFDAAYKLADLRRAADRIFEQVDMLLVPTAPAHYTLADIARKPIEYNSRLGYYTNFVNLLGMSALALPGGFRQDGLPAGITLIGPGGADHRLAEFALALEPFLHRQLGNGTLPLPAAAPGAAMLPPLAQDEPTVRVAVVGAHLSGMPLNWQLRERGAWRVAETRTAPHYRLFALPDTVPPKPGMVRVRDDGRGASVVVEVWEMPQRHFGSFVAEIPAPLAIGTLTLEDGSHCHGFLCEDIAVHQAKDITSFGGWRAYLAAQQAPAAPSP